MEQRQTSLTKTTLCCDRTTGKQILEGRSDGRFYPRRPAVHIPLALESSRLSDGFDGRELVVRRRGLHLRLSMRGVMYHVRLGETGPSTLEYRLPCPRIWGSRFNGWNGGIDELGGRLFSPTLWVGWRTRSSLLF